MKIELKIRKRNRLPHYDYSQNGYYSITICTKNHKTWFGEVVKGKIMLNDLGKIVRKCWEDLPMHYNNCQTDTYVIMPNHFHGIVIIDNEPVVTGFKPVTTKKPYDLSEIIRGFKTFSSRQINEILNHKRFQWQRSFYDHIIRNDKSLLKIQEYILNNPTKWELGEDEYNPENVETGFEPV